MEIQIGNIVNGVTILNIERRKTTAGQQRQYVQFGCKCGATHWTLASVVAKTKSGIRGRRNTLRCAECQKRREREQARKLAAKVEVEPPPVTENGVPQVSPEAYWRLRQQPDDVQRIANRIIYAHVRACLLNRAAIENADRLFVEAIDLAKQELRQGPTVEVVPAWEPFRRYDQYLSPRAD